MCYKNYIHEFGELLAQIFQSKVSCIEKKKIIAMCQKFINRGETMEANDLIIQPDSVVTLLQNTSLDTVVKPLKKEIFLFDTFAAGTSYLNDQSVLTELAAGDSLTIRREDNKYDERACLLLAPNGKKVGYIPQADNIIFSRLLDSGKLLTAKVTKIEQVDPFYTRVNIAIYLVDF